MKSFRIVITALLVVCGYAAAQDKLPLIASDSMKISVRDGNLFKDKAWLINPSLKPDIYKTGGKPHSVTFYTNSDSISFEVKAESEYDFIILLQGKDSAYTRVKSSPDYLARLKKASKYDYTDDRPIPRFVYQPEGDPDFRNLRTAFNLDSIAGGGDQVSRILSMMHWVHNLIPHNGTLHTPGVRNAPGLIKICTEEHRGLNCRGLATVLSECYLSLGIKSRMVICMPKDTVFDDCHVINAVFCDELDRWLWIDPTHDAYVMDEEGNLLGIEEVRERLIKNKPLIINPDANWNHRTSTLKEAYLYEYMAKNLYRLKSPVHNTFDTEGIERGKTVEYIELLPLDAINQFPPKKVRTNPQTGMTYVTYKTTNPDLFWQKPPR
jgi:transglutaminase-like putative cysteine protease